MASRFLEALHSGRALLMDGAMGTELQRAGIQPGECHELWNLTHPEKVLAIHRAYVEAGAEVLLTNTFQANPQALAKHGLEGKLEAILESGIRLSREACGRLKYVLAGFGPMNGFHESKVLHGTDGCLLETWSDLAAIALGPESIPTLIAFTYHHGPTGELQTIAGITPEEIARQSTKVGFAALGVNCGRDITMDDCIEIIRRYRSVTKLPLFARPNAGTPKLVDGRWVYPRTPEEMAAKLPGLLEAGVAMVGGCCGTTPAHIAAFRQVVDEWNAKKKAALP